MPDADAIHVEPSVDDEPLDIETIPLVELARRVLDNSDDATPGSITVRRLAAALLDPERDRAIRHAERLRLADLFEANAGLLNTYAESGPVELVSFLLRLDHG